jgi:hypothetical protein
MKGIFYLLLGLMMGAAADGQGLPKSDSVLLQWKLKITDPFSLSISCLLQSPEMAQGLLSTPGGPVRVLKPDFMSCLVPDLAKVERIPIRWEASADPMPNGFHLNRPRPIYVVPGHPVYVMPGHPVYVMPGDK